MLRDDLGNSHKIIHSDAQGGDVFPPKDCDETLIAPTVAGGGLKPEAAPRVQETMGRYTAEKEFARGGMGRILIAFDTLLAREVVIKELLPHRDIKAQTRAVNAQAPGSSHPMMRRFLQEARVTGALEHPSIVPVYELGNRADGTPYYTMKVVRGKTLAQAIAGADSLRERLLLLPHYHNLCQAVAYAHSRGVIHRDLKPANVMIGDFGETVVIDWGLARKLEDANAPTTSTAELLSGTAPDEGEEEMDATCPGVVMGTPLYMAPEQAMGDVALIGKHTDVYALGVILYEIITGRVPHSFSSLEEAVSKVTRETPAPIETVEPDAPRTLAAISARAMHKNPAQRYADAADLARDVDHFLGGALVEAYDYRFSDHFQRFVRRHRRVLSVASVLLSLLLATAAVSYVQVTLQRNVATDARRAAERALAAEEAARLRAEEQRQLVAGALEKEEAARIDAEKAENAATRALYNARISLAASHVVNGYFERARQLLATCPQEHRNWEWGRLQYMCNQAYRVYEQQLQWNASVLDQGYWVDALHGRVMVENADVSGRLVSAFTGEELYNYVANTATDFFVAVSPRGGFTLTRERAEAWLRRSNDARLLAQLTLFNHWRWSFAFSADETMLAARSAPEEVALICLRSGLERRRFSEVGLTMARLSGDGAYIATTASATDEPEKQSLVIRDVLSGEVRLRAIENEISVLEFAPHEPALLAGNQAGELTLWRPDVPDPVWRKRPHTAGIKRLAFPADYNAAAPGQALALALYDDGVLWLGSLDGGSERWRIAAPGNKAGAAAISDDGAHVAVGVAQRIHIHETGQGSLLRVLEGHEADVLQLAFSSDGELLYSATSDDVRVWRVDAPGAIQRLNMDTVSSIAWLSEKGCLRTAAACGTLQDWSWPELERAGVVLVPEDDAARRTLLSPRGDRMVCETDTGLFLRDVETNRTLAEFPRRSLGVTPTAFSPDGRWLALLEADAVAQQADVVLYDAREGAHLATMTLYARETPWDFTASAMAFSPDGETLAVSAWNRVVFYKIPEAYEEGHLDIPEQRDRQANVCRFSSDGTVLAVTGGRDRVSLFALTEAEPRGARCETSRVVSAIAFSRDGSRIALGDAGGMVTLRCADTGVELMSEALFNGGFSFLQFTEDDEALIAGDGNQCLLLRAFPWRDALLPGDVRVPLAQRLEALRTYHPQIAPLWGRCQRNLCLLDELNAQKTCAPGEEEANAAASCPGGGAYARDHDGAPSCSIHGPLRNPAYLLRHLTRYEEQGIGRELLWRALPESCEGLGGLVRTWFFHEPRHVSAALLACEKGLQACPDNEALIALKLAALLAADDGDAALEWSRTASPKALRAHDNATQLALLLARRGGREDARLAAGLLADSVAADTNPIVQQAYALLQQSHYWSDDDWEGALTGLLEPRSEERREMPWHASLEDALQAAQTAGKTVMINLSVPDSAAMRRLREDIFSVASIQEELLSYFEPVTLDALGDPELLDRYGVTVLPALVFLDAQGALLRVSRSGVRPYVFVERFFSGFRETGALRDWRIIGPFKSGGCAELEAEARGGVPDFTREHAGKTGPAGWRAYRQPPVYHHVDLEDFYPDLLNAVFYAYTCFDVDADCEVVPAIIAGETCHAWLNGEDISYLANHEYRTNRTPEPLKLQAGRHHLFLKLSSRWNVNFRASLKRQPGVDDAIITSCVLPDAPPLTLLNRRQQRAERQADAEAFAQPNVHHLTVNKREILREWRENYVDILITLNPTPVFEKGEPVGLRAEHPENIAILAASGFKNGDIIVSVNGYTFGGEYGILEIAELTEGANPYILKVKRGDEEHTFYVHVE